MTTEFRIDRPGVYVNRCGEHKNIIPTGFPDKWCVTAIHGMPKFVHGNGRVSIAWRSEYDVVAYVGPLPADVLQRMREALALAEEQSKLTYEQREKHACDVCGNVPDEEGFIQHGRGCHVVNEDGGGITLVDFDEDQQQ